jgi:hypothetical protein
VGGREVGLEVAIAVQGGDVGPDRGVRGLDGGRGAQGPALIEGLRRAEQLDGDDLLGVLDDLAEETLEQAKSSEAELVAKLEGHGMTFITQEDGLDIERFRTAVSAEVEKDFPDWKPYMERISNTR